MRTVRGPLLIGIGIAALAQAVYSQTKRETVEQVSNVSQGSAPTGAIQLSQGVLSAADKIDPRVRFDRSEIRRRLGQDPGRDASEEYGANHESSTRSKGGSAC
jgi:hypothetical protein